MAEPLLWFADGSSLTVSLCWLPLHMLTIWTKNFKWGFITPQETDFQHSACVIGITFFSCFPSLKMTSWQPHFHWDCFWSRFSEHRVQEMTFRCGSSTVDFFSLFFPFFFFRSASPFFVLQLITTPTSACTVQIIQLSCIGPQLLYIC